jgi:hypothetical protein
MRHLIGDATPELGHLPEYEMSRGPGAEAQIFGRHEDRSASSPMPHHADQVYLACCSLAPGAVEVGWWPLTSLQARTDLPYSPTNGYAARHALGFILRTQLQVGTIRDSRP